MKRLVPVVLLLLLGAGVWPMGSSLAAACGIERWPVKTGTDPDAANETAARRQRGSLIEVAERHRWKAVG